MSLSRDRRFPHVRGGSLTWTCSFRRSGSLRRDTKTAERRGSADVADPLRRGFSGKRAEEPEPRGLPREAFNLPRDLDFRQHAVGASVVTCVRAVRCRATFARKRYIRADRDCAKRM